MAGKRMKETAKKETRGKKEEVKKTKKENGGFIDKFKEKVKSSEKTALSLIIIAIFCAIAIYFGFIFIKPAYEITFGEMKYLEASQIAGDYAEGTAERQQKDAEANEAKNEYYNMRDAYATNANPLVIKFSRIHSLFLRITIMLIVLFFAIILPISFCIKNVKVLFYTVFFIVFYKPYEIIKNIVTVFKSSDNTSKSSKKAKAKKDVKKDAKKTSSKHSKKLETA